MTVSIRRAKFEDVQGILDIWVDFMALLARTNPHYWEVHGGPLAFSKFLESSLAAPDVLTAVAEAAGTGQVGFALARIEVLPEWFGSEQIGLIRYLAVAENFRGRGVGRALATFVLDWFRSVGIKRVELYVLKDLPASGFWSGMGFEVFLDRRFREI